MRRRVDLPGGEGLVFVFSMPRSGSTLLSRVLGAHPEVLSPPEPWFLLPLADLLGVGNLGGAPYGVESALLASAKYLDRLVVAGDGAWLGAQVGSAARARIAGEPPEGIFRELGSSIYARDLRRARRKLFVDKTPRYYWILPLIERMFPRARKIFLVRNPLDIASSYKATWGIPVDELCGKVVTANSYDFCKGLFDLESYFARRSATKLIVSYETLVRQPKTELARVCRFIGTKFEPAMLNHHADSRLTREFAAAVVGDPRANRNPAPIDTGSVSRWRTHLSRDEKQALVAIVGSAILRRLGYPEVLLELRKEGISIPTAGASAALRAEVLGTLEKGRKGRAKARGDVFARMADGLLAERSSLAQAVSHLTEKIAVLSQGKVEKSAELDRLSANLASLTADRLAVLAANQQLEAELLLLKRNQAEREGVIAHLESDNAALRRGQGELEVVRALLSSDLEKVTADRGELLAGNERLAGELTELKADHAARGKVIERLGIDMAALGKAREAASETVAKQRTELERLTADRAEALARNERMLAERKALTDDQAAKAQVIERLVAQLAALGKTHEAASEAVAKQRAELERLTADRAEALARNERMLAERKALTDDQAAKAQVIERLVAQLTESGKAGEEAAASIARLEAEFKDLSVDRAGVLERNERLEAEIGALQADQAAKAQVIGHLSAELAALGEKFATTTERLETDLRRADAERAQLLARGEGLAADKAALESDRHERSQAIAYLATKLADLRKERQSALEAMERHQSNQAIMLRKLAAKDEILRTAAARELGRKLWLEGVPDLLWQSQRHRLPRPYGHMITGAQAGGRLHVAVDAIEIVFGVSGGVEVYMKMLVSALLEGGHRVTVLCLPDQVQALQREFGDRAGYFVVHASRAARALAAVAGKLGMRHRLTADRTLSTFSRLAEDLGAQLLHSPVQIFSTLDFRVPAVLNLHDLQHLHFPENFKPSDIEARNYLYGLSASLADAIVTSSEFVRNDLITRMGVAPRKVFTVPVTWDPRVERGLEKFSEAQAQATYRLPANYALYPAQFWPHKNHARLVEALRIVRDHAPASDLHLVLTGYRGHSGWPKVEETIRRLGLENQVQCLDYVPVEHLAGLYKGAAFCVVPSTFEASSYPVIEAQMLGVPAMCAAVTSLPELMRGESGLLFDPFDVGDIAAKMLRWVVDPADARSHAERASVKVRQDHGIANYMAGIDRVYQYALGGDS